MKKFQWFTIASCLLAASAGSAWAQGATQLPAPPMPPPAPAAATEAEAEGTAAPSVEAAQEPLAPAPWADPTSASDTDPAPASAGEIPPVEPAAVQPAPLAAPEPVTAPAASAPPVDEGAYRHDESDGCLLGKLCMGPVLTLGGINPFGIGIQTRYDEDWGFGLDYQFLPSVGTDEASASIYLLTVDARYYPTGAFFLSGGFALQGLNAEASTVMASFDPSTGMPSTANINVEGSVTIPMLKLGLGLLGSEGFVMGIDLALGIPLGGTDVDFAVSGGSQNAEAMQEAEQLQEDVQEFADLAIDMMPVLVQVNLLRIGYIF